MDRWWRGMVRTTLGLRCPACGRGRLFLRGFTLREICEACEARYERWPGSWLGPPVLGYSVGAVAALAVGLWMWWIDRFTAGVEWLLAAVACATALVTYRYAKAWWIWLLHATGWVFPDSEAPPEGEPLRPGRRR